jgi:chemotaxis family two-component system sensor kinase Cph1
MTDLLDILLQYSRLGRTDLAVGPADLEAIVGEVLDSLQYTIEECGVTIERPAPLPVVRCDRARVGEVFRNLITNAIKYNDKHQRRVEIGARIPEQPGSPVVFHVRDNGIGIREKHLESVFRIFKRLHGRDQFGGGTGAGLTIAKKIVERHGGRIWIESAFGEGTTVFFTLHGEIAT